MVQRAGADHQSVYTRPLPGDIDDRTEEESAEAAADEVRHEAEIGQQRVMLADRVLRSTVEFGESGRHAAIGKNVKGDPFVLDYRLQGVRVELPPLVPQPWLANGIVEVAVIGRRRFVHPHQCDRMLHHWGRRRRMRRPRRHLELGDRNGQSVVFSGHGLVRTVTIGMAVGL